MLLKIYIVLACVLAWTACAFPVYRDMVPNGKDLNRWPAVGHVNKHGGGLLNGFGNSFARAGSHWTKELCVEDSDKDGQSNGVELGDPCCFWTEGNVPTRTILLSLPGHSGSRTDLKRAGYSPTPMHDPDFKRPDGTIGPPPDKTFLPLLEEVGYPGCKCLDYIGEAGGDDEIFWQFYWDGQKNEGLGRGTTFTGVFVDVVDSLIFVLTHPGDVFTWLSDSVRNAMLVVIVGIVAYSLFYRHTISEAAKLGFRQNLKLFVMIAVYIDFTSCFLHFVLDNNMYNNWPLIGQAAAQFQGHHFDPSGITRGAWKFFLREADLILGLIQLACLLRYQDVRLRIAAFHGVWMTNLMMASHRWSHYPPHEVPSLIYFLQNTGIMLSAGEHSKHHLTYDNNFGIFGGWCNPLMNFINVTFIDANWGGWSVVLVTWCFLPTIVSYLVDNQTMQQLYQKRLQPSVERMLRFASDGLARDIDSHEGVISFVMAASAIWTFLFAWSRLDTPAILYMALAWIGLWRFTTQMLGAAQGAKIKSKKASREAQTPNNQMLRALPLFAEVSLMTAMLVGTFDASSNGEITLRALSGVAAGIAICGRVYRYFIKSHRVIDKYDRMAYYLCIWSVICNTYHFFYQTQAAAVIFPTAFAAWYMAELTGDLKSTWLATLK